MDEKEEATKQCIEQLLKEKSLYIRDNIGITAFDASSIDIEYLINKTMEKSDNIQQAVELLNKEYLQVPVLPDEYNYEYKMIRYYCPVYILDDDLANIENLIWKNYYDGNIAYVITNKEKKDLIHNMNVDRCIYVYRKESKRY